MHLSITLGFYFFSNFRDVARRPGNSKIILYLKLHTIVYLRTYGIIQLRSNIRRDADDLLTMFTAP